MKIGFVGLGIMGSAMAANLRRAGYRVTVWNRTQEPVRRFLESGGEAAGTPREAAASSDVVISMMADPVAVRAVRDGENGIIAGLSEGRGYIDMSTIDPETSCETAELVRTAGGRYLEAPVAGSRKPAEDATLTIMAAGDRLLYDSALSALETMGKKILFVGDVGDAARMKLANNLVMGGMLTALCEGLALASRSGLDATQLLEVLDSGAMSNPMFRLKGASIAAGGEFPAAFPLKHMQKDLRLALVQAERVGQPLFAAATANEYFKAALASGWGDADFAAVSRVINR